jgi:hypothetical protein
VTAADRAELEALAEEHAAGFREGYRTAVRQLVDVVAEAVTTAAYGYAALVVWRAIRRRKR